MYEDDFKAYAFDGPDSVEEAQAMYDEAEGGPLVDRMRTAILLQNSAVKALIIMVDQLKAHSEEHHNVINEQAQRIRDTEKRVEFLEQMLMAPKEES